MDRGHNDDYNNGLEGRIRTILHFANENERYLHWRSSLTSLTPARIRVHARAIMCMNYILYMTHTHTEVQNWAIITHFDSFLGASRNKECHTRDEALTTYRWKRTPIISVSSSLHSLRLGKECYIHFTFRRRSCCTPPTLSPLRCGTMYSKRS